MSRGGRFTARSFDSGNPPEGGGGRGEFSSLIVPAVTLLHSPVTRSRVKKQLRVKFSKNDKRIKNEDRNDWKQTSNRRGTSVADHSESGVPRESTAKGAA